MGCCISEKKEGDFEPNEKDNNEEKDTYYALNSSQENGTKNKNSGDSYKVKSQKTKSKLNKLSSFRTNLTKEGSQSQSVKYKKEIEKDMSSARIKDRIRILIKLDSLQFVFDNFLYVYHSTFNPIIKISDGRVTREYKNLTEKKIDKRQNTKDQSYHLTKQSANTSGGVNEFKSYKDNSMSQTEADVLNLMNTSMGIDADLEDMSTDNDVGVLLNFEENINSKEFIINTKYSKEIHNWLNIELSNEIVYYLNSVEMPLAVGYLPINLILFQQNHPKQPLKIKIPLTNPIDNVIIAYLNVLIENKCDYELLKPITEDIARCKLINFYSSKNILNINDMDPFLLEKYFSSQNSFDKQYADEALNREAYESFSKIFGNSNFEEIQNIILEKKEMKLPYDWEIYNPCKYYTFLTITNETFGKSLKIRDLKDTANDSELDRIIKAGKKFFNIINFQPDFETNNSDTNCPIVNNILSIFVTFYKEKIHEKDFCEKELCDIFSIQNFFRAFGESYYKVLEKISKFDDRSNDKANSNINQEKEGGGSRQILNKIKSYFFTSNQVVFDSTEHLDFILHKSIQNNFLILTNLILETYLKQGMHPKKSMIFTTKKIFFQNEVHSFKQKIKEYFLLTGIFLKDSNFVFGVLKVLISFIKFVKLFCYLNSFNHSNVYIDSLLNRDNTPIQWILSVYNEYLTNPRLFPMFIELVFEISDELKGIQFFQFKKFFELPLFTMNFTPYLKSPMKNELVLHFIVRIFLKFSTFTHNDQRQFLDFISLRSTEIDLLYTNSLNILLVITKEEIFSVFSQKFKKVSDIETIRLYSSKKIPTRYYFSFFNIQIFTKILSILTNLFQNLFQFKTYFSAQNRIKMLKLVMKYVAAFVFFDVDYFLQENEENEEELKSAGDENNKVIYFELFEKSLIYLRTFLLATNSTSDFNLNIKGMLKEVVEEICFNILFEENELWSDFLFNLSKKLEKYCRPDRFLKYKGKKKIIIDEISDILDKRENEVEMNPLEDYF